MLSVDGKPPKWHADAPMKELKKVKAAFDLSGITKACVDLQGYVYIKMVSMLFLIDCSVGQGSAQKSAMLFKIYSSCTFLPDCLKNQMHYRTKWEIL